MSTPAHTLLSGAILGLGDVYIDLVEPASGRTPEGTLRPFASLDPFLFEAKQGVRGAWRSDVFKMLSDTLHDCRRVQGQIDVDDRSTSETVSSLIA